MAEPGSPGNHWGHFCPTATPRGLLRALGCRLLSAETCPSIVLPEAAKKTWFACSAARWGRGWWGSWPGLPGAGQTDGQQLSATSHLSAFLKNMQTNNNINPHSPSTGGWSHASSLRSYSLSAPRFLSLSLVYWEPQHWTKMKENGKAPLKVDYIYFSTHPPAVDVSTEKGILLSFLSP